LRGFQGFLDTPDTKRDEPKEVTVSLGHRRVSEGRAGPQPRPCRPSPCQAHLRDQDPIWALLFGYQHCGQRLFLRASPPSNLQRPCPPLINHLAPGKVPQTQGKASNSSSLLPFPGEAASCSPVHLPSTSIQKRRLARLSVSLCETKPCACKALSLRLLSALTWPA
jgi:hypothetical protein